MPVSSRFARKTPSIRPTVGKFCTPGEADPPPARRGTRHEPERVGAADAGQHGGVAGRPAAPRGPSRRRSRWRRRREEPGQRAAPRHPVATGVVDDDEVAAAGLGALGRQAGAGPGADDRRCRRRPVARSRSQRLLVASWSSVAAPSSSVRSCRRVGHRRRERRIVDVRVHLGAARRAASAVLESLDEQASSASGSSNGPPSASRALHPAEGHEERGRALRPGSLAPTRRPSSAHLLRRRAHERHGGVVHVAACGPSNSLGHASRAGRS